MIPSIDSTVHIDIPYHFFENVLFVEIEHKEFIRKYELIEKLEIIEDKSDYTFLIAKTGICAKRDTRRFWKQNFGFDGISVSSFANRMTGREAHKEFLDPKHPKLLLEDIDLTKVNQDTCFRKVTIAPMRVAKFNGLTCIVGGETT